jgi:acetyltransferase-like isoleucine patch superfamily enzyme
MTGVPWHRTPASATEHPRSSPSLAAIRNALREELSGLDPLASAGLTLARLLPEGNLQRLRVHVLNAFGFSIGRGTLLDSSFTLTGQRDARRNLKIGVMCYINRGCVFDALAPIDIGDEVSFGHEVLITTSAHRIGTPERRAGLVEPRPVRIGHGAWLASRAVILPGVEIGDGAIVAAGAVVTRSVPPNVLVGGAPARVIREL